MVTYNVEPAFFHPNFNKRIGAIETPDLVISQKDNCGTQQINFCAITDGNGLEKIGDDKIILSFDELATVVNGVSTYQSLLEQKLSELINETVVLTDRL